MIALFVMLRRFVRAIVDAWSSDVAFRILLALVVSLLVSGTTFFHPRGGLERTTSSTSFRFSNEG